MKLPMPDEAKVAIARAQGDMELMRQEMTEVKNLLKAILTAQYEVNGVEIPERLTDLLR